MSDNLREIIITSKTSERMLEETSPIYDNSVIGLWIFEAIGRTYDELWDVLDTLPDQLFPETATWSIELWERRYGITPPTEATLEERQNAVANAWRRTATKHDRIETWLEEQTGGEAKIIHNVDSYTFRIEISRERGMASFDFDKAIRFINKNKPSHLSYSLDFKAERTIGMYRGAALAAREEGVYSVPAQTIVGDYYTDEYGEAALDENGTIMMTED